LSELVQRIFECGDTLTPRNELNILTYGTTFYVNRYRTYKTLQIVMIAVHPVYEAAFSCY